MPPPSAQRSSLPLGLRLIAGTKIVKGLALLGIALGLFHLAHSDGLERFAHGVVDFLKISPENRYARLLLEKAGVAQPRQMRQAGLVSVIYSLILLTEGTSLWFGAPWAEYLIVVSTGAFVPEELYSCFLAFTWTKLAVLLVNAAILAYVVSIVWKRLREKALQRSAAENSP